MATTYTRKIKVLNTTFNRLGVIKKILAVSKTEEINGEYSLNFEAMLDSSLSVLDENSIFEIDNDYFDIAFFKKSSSDDGDIIEVESEHISYRLNDPIYNVETFTEYGTPTYILGKILEGTDFTVGTMEYVNILTYSAQEAKSRRQLLTEFAALLGGELVFNQFSISIVQHRGNSTPTLLMNGKNINIISRTVDKRERDEDGNYIVTVTCEPIYLPGNSYVLGDEVKLVQNTIGVNQNLRIMKYIENPYTNEVEFEINNSVSGLAASIFRIETEAMVKDKLYNGIRIGPVYGFEAIRNDLKARAYFRSDGMMFQTGDGSGDPNMWRNRLYYDYDSELDETILVFDGTLSADMIEALSALITPNLYAEKATISELTVDGLETSTKVKKYLDQDTSDVNYIKIYGQTIKFITSKISENYSPELIAVGVWGTDQMDTYYSSMSINPANGAIRLSGGTPTAVPAITAYNTGFIYRALDADSYYRLTAVIGTSTYYSVYDVIEGETTSEQVKNLKDELMYWTDETYTVATTEVTAFPVLQFVYNELVKQSMSFEYDEVSGQYLPMNIFGTGTGTTETSGQGRLQKNTDGLALSYNSSDGTKTAEILMGDDGLVDVTARRADILVDTANSEIIITPEGTDQDNIVIGYTEVGNKLTMTWPDGQSFDVEVV